MLILSPELGATILIKNFIQKSQSRTFCKKGLQVKDFFIRPKSLLKNLIRKPPRN
jgi:hypothetical protein